MAELLRLREEGCSGGRLNPSVLVGLERGQSRI